ncbi:MAG: hypothetical protein QXX35_02425 [Desulfurococcaceae archaeon]|uniref:HEPN domain-containing protein n=1 Tax=Staphylothermus marinus TaxID=2280 RepID=A0A7C4H894_STAMA
MSNEFNDMQFIRKRLGRIMYCAINGYYRTVFNNDKVVNKAFLDIIKETYKALTVLNKYIEEIGVESNA